jgi:two-component system response regulator GlrR
MDKILVVDDDQNILKVLKMRLEAKGYQVLTESNAEDALKTAENEIFDLALVDLKLEGKSGIELMEDLQKVNPLMPIIILTAFGTVKTAVEAMKKGAHSYLTKPYAEDELLLQIRNCLEKSRLLKEVRRLKDMVTEKFGNENIIAKSEKMKEVFEQVTLAAETESIVFISGESGTGKELIAKHLHVASARREGPFVPVNCAAIPDTLIESEIFGYEKGAFTGASRSRRGLFSQANGGTLFLDEISEMSSQMQAKLLRVIEEGIFHPLGGEKTVKADCRMIAASNKNLEEEVKNGRFRDDLFYRINVIRIALPPLRERKEDIPVLAKHFLKTCSAEMKKEVVGLSAPALQKLMRHSWPGNVRELRNAIERAIAMTRQNVITEDLIFHTQENGEEGFKSLKEARMDFEKSYLINLVELTEGNVSQAAKLAGKYRADLYELLRKYHIDPEDYRSK